MLLRNSNRNAKVLPANLLPGIGVVLFMSSVPFMPSLPTLKKQNKTKHLKSRNNNNNTVLSGRRKKSTASATWFGHIKD